MSDGKNNSNELPRWLERMVILSVAAYFVALHVWNPKAELVSLVLWPGEGGGSSLKLTAPLIVTGSFIAGFLVAALLTIIATLQRGAQLRQSQKRITTLEQEIARLRNLPIDEDLHAPPEPASTAELDEPDAS